MDTGFSWNHSLDCAVKRQLNFIPSYVSLVDLSSEIEKKLTPQFVNTSYNFPLDSIL